MVDVVKYVHAAERTKTLSIERRKRKCETYYANPPQRPSRLISVNTKKMLKLSDSSPKSPTADSYIKAKNIRHWVMAGKDINRTGSAGIPRDIADREKKTVVWYTSFVLKNIKKISQ